LELSYKAWATLVFKLLLSLTHTTLVILLIFSSFAHTSFCPLVYTIIFGSSKNLRMKNPDQV